MNSEKINAAVAKIREILNEHPGGESNNPARNSVIGYAEAIIYAAPDEGYVREKASDIKSKIDRYYSARKHLRHKEDYQSGAQVLRGEIDSLLVRIETWHGWEK